MPEAVQTRAWGVHLRDDLARYLAAAPVRTVFDVGAHEGESMSEFSALFPTADVFSFEPVPETFARLQARAAAHPRARAFNLALADAPGRRTIRRGRHACLSSLLPQDREFAWPTSTLDTPIGVTCDTVDGVAERLDIQAIDLLKIDVQGAEQLVLAGATRLLTEQRIRAVKLEVLFLALYESQPSFGALLSLLEGHGFRFMGLYDHFYDGHGWLCWADALFVHGRTRTGVPLPQLP